MARQGISTGIVPNDGTGDTLAGGAVKINQNFSEIYSFLGDGTNLNGLKANDLSLAGVTTGLNVPGISTLGFVEHTTLNVSGFSTLGDASAANLSAANLTLAGVTTGLNVPGISTLGFVQHTTLVVSGVSTLSTLSSLSVGTGGTVITTISGGNIGIGTTNPNAKAKLDVRGAHFVTANAVYNNESNPGLKIQNNTTTGSSGLILGCDSSINAAYIQPLLTGTTYAHNLVIAAMGGNVGIATTNPLTKLDVRGALNVGGATEGIRLGNVGDNSAYDNVKLYYTGYNSANPRVYLTPRTQPGSGVVNTYLYLQSNTVGGPGSNTMGLLVDGSVGIGTTNPGAKLDVRGDHFITVDGSYNNESNPGLKIRSKNTSGSSGLILGCDSSINAAYIKPLLTGTSYHHNLVIAAMGGNVGIGTTIPISKLSVWQSSNTSPTAQFYNGGGSAPATVHIVEDGASSTHYGLYVGGITFNDAAPILVTKSTNVGIGTSSPAKTLHVRGGIRNTNRNSASTQTALHINTTTGDIAETASSRRFKRNITNYEKGLETLNQLRPVSFQFLEDDLPNTGLIAEEVNELGLPEFIRYDADGNPYSIPYDNLSALYINAIKQLSEKVDALEAEINALKSK